MKQSTIGMYPLGNTYPTSHEVPMPLGSRVLSAAIQDGSVVVWALVPVPEPGGTHPPSHVRRIVTMWTSQQRFMPPEENFRFIATLTFPTGVVLHVFDMGEGPNREFVGKVKP